jgi:hypothetical protein
MQFSPWKGLVENSQVLRFIFGILWPNVISNEYLWETAKQKETWKMRYQKWKWIDHILRQDDKSIPKKALEWNQQGGRRKGRPRNTWRSTVRMEAEHQGKNWPKIKSLSKNKIRQRTFIKALCLSKV